MPNLIFGIRAWDDIKRGSKGIMVAGTKGARYLEQDEAELAAMSDSLLTKLEKMSDEEFDSLEKFPDFDY